jgi:hypothetical protein
MERWSRALSQSDAQFKELFGITKKVCNRSLFFQKNQFYCDPNTVNTPFVQYLSIFEVEINILDLSNYYM